MRVVPFLIAVACAPTPPAPEALTPEPRLVGVWALDTTSTEARTLTALAAEGELRAPELEALRSFVRAHPETTLAGRVAAAAALASTPLLRVDATTLRAFDSDGEHAATWTLERVDVNTQVLVTHHEAGATTRTQLRFDGPDRLRLGDEQGGDTLTLRRVQP